MSTSNFSSRRVGVGLLIGLGIVGYFIWQAERPGPVIFLKLPVGFQGGFRIIENPTTGVNASRIDGRYVYTIPASGTLYVKTSKLFGEWHSLQAAYANGTPIASEFADLNGAPVRLFQLGAIGASTGRIGNGPTITTSQEDWCFVGTRTQKTAFDWPTGRSLGSVISQTSPSSTTGP